MRGRTLGVVSVTVVLLVLGAGAVGFATGRTERTEANTLEFESKAIRGELQGLREAIERQSLRAPVKCQTFKCINKLLTVLSNGVVVLSDAVLALLHEVVDCEQLMNVTQYFGYEYDDGFGGTVLTTALDQTEPGDTAGARVVVYAC